MLRIRTLLISAVATFLFASVASAVTLQFGGANDPSLHGATGSLTIFQTGVDTYEVRWTMDTTGFDDAGAIATGHPELTDIAFKAFTSMTSVTFLGASTVIGGVTSPQTGTLFWPSNVSNAGCAASSPAGFVCLDVSPNLLATTDQVFTARFSVTGAIDWNEWSYRGKFGPARGWVISESAPPIPEPTSAAVFGLGALIVGAALRRKMK